MPAAKNTTAATEPTEALPPITESLPIPGNLSDTTVDASGEVVKEDSVYLTTLPSTVEGVAAANSMLVARLVEVGFADHVAEDRLEVAAMQNITLRRSFSRTITISGVELVIPDLAGESGAYKTELEKVSKAAIAGLETQLLESGLPRSMAQREAEGRINAAQGKVRARVRKILDRELSADQLKMHGFKWSAGLGKGQTLPKPAARQAQDRVTTAVRETTEEVTNVIAGVATTIGGDDPHAMIMALLPILHAAAQQLLPAPVKANRKALEATYRDLTESVRAIGVKWELVRPVGATK